MKRKIFLLPLLAMLLASCFTSCKDDNDGPQLPYVYLNYRIEVLDNGIINALANFTTAPYGGQRLKLTGGSSINVNGKSLVYYATDPDQENTFDYGTDVTNRVTDGMVNFVFRHSTGDVVTSSFDLNTLPDFTIPELSPIIKGKTYELFDEPNMNSSVQYRVQLIGDNNKVYDATFTPAGFSFSNAELVPGFYTLRYIQTSSKNISSAPGVLGGIIEVWKVKTRAGVRVEN